MVIDLLVTINPSVTLSFHEGEAVLYNKLNGMFFGLDQVGTEIWNMLAEERTIDEIVETMHQEYGVDRDRLLQDIHALLDQLVASKLVSKS